MTNSPAPLAPAMRDTLFGDMPWPAWPSHQNTEPLEPPWTLFAEARLGWEAKDRHRAIAILQEITQLHGLESRHYLQAWKFLRMLEVAPTPQIEKFLYGVVIEVAVEGSFDLLAAYLDGTARYYNHAGGAIVWERPNELMDTHIEQLFSAGRIIVDKIGFWEGDRPPPPIDNQARINFLTPGGLCFGQADIDTLANDPLAGPVIRTGTILMGALIDFEQGQV